MSANSQKNFKEELTKILTDSASKETTLSLTSRIIESPNLLSTLYECIWTSQEKIQWRASWVFEHVFLDQPQLIIPYLPDIVDRFSSIKSDGVKRHMSKILSLSNISQMATGNLINTCFEWLMSELIPVAVKVHCMQILFNTCNEYPDLKSELKTVIEAQIPYNSIGFKSRATKILKSI